MTKIKVARSNKIFANH